MIYPFTVVKVEQDQHGGWGVTIRMQQVTKYEPALDPAEEFKKPILSDVEGFYYVDSADSEEEALDEVARRVSA